MSIEQRIAEELMFEIREFIPRKADCYTLICDFYERCYGIDLPRYDYDSVKQEKPPERVWEDWQEVAVPEPGNVILMRSDDGIHIGVMINEEHFLHSTFIERPPVRIGRISEIPAGIPTIFLRYRT